VDEIPDMVSSEAFEASRLDASMHPVSARALRCRCNTRARTVITICKPRSRRRVTLHAKKSIGPGCSV
jgi:hypothetical protein